MSKKSGRLITQFPFRELKAIGVEREVEVRMFLEEGTSLEFTAEVEQDGILLKGTDPTKLIEDAFEQLRKLHPIEWHDKLVISFDKDGLFDTNEFRRDAGLSIDRAQVGTSKLGPVFRFEDGSGRAISAKKKGTKVVWGPVERGELKTGKYCEEGRYNKRESMRLVCDPTDEIAQAVEVFGDKIKQFMKAAAEMMEHTFETEGEAGLLRLSSAPALTFRGAQHE